MQVNIISLDGQQAGTLALNASVFGVEVRKDLLHRAVMWQLQNRRVVTANTKDRGEVSGSTKKIVRQKGSGGARHGDRKTNIFRHGGIVFGPKTRVISHDMPKKVRALALKSALSSKVAENNFVVISEAKTTTHKTKDLASKLAKLNLENALFIVDSMDTNFEMAARNLPFVRILPSAAANVYDILKAEKVVLTKDAVAMIEARVNKG